MTIPAYQNYNGTPLIPAPPNLLVAPVDYSQQYQDQLNNALRLYFTLLNNFSQALATPDYGATTQRPIAKQLVGQQFFDTTLGYPIWWSGSKWVNYNGTAV
jgi:hypothetical protein